MKKQKNFLKIYLCFTAVLLLIMAICLINVGLTLKDYEKSQPEHLAAENMDKICSAAKGGTLSSALKLDELDDDEIAELTKALSGNSLELRQTQSLDAGAKRVYSIVSGEDTLVDITLESKDKGTKLLLFKMLEWSVSDVSVSYYNYDLTLPKSLKLIVSGTEVVGTETDGGIKYSVHSVKKPVVTIRDILGNEAVYNGRSFTAEQFVITVPNSYIITTKSGEIVPITMAEQKDGKEFGTFPEGTLFSTYTLNLVNKNPEIVIIDNFGGTVDYTISNNTIQITEFASLPDIPETVIAKETVLSHARKWSLFMTDDLGGAKHGYGQIEEFVHPDSKILEVASAWAGSVDITFTSVHTLNNPPFHEESVSNFIQYNSDNFSVDLKLSKIMHLNSGDDVEDTMNYRFYYTLKDGEWYLYDMIDISKKTAENVLSEEDVLSHAREWSLFMTDDIGGDDHGYSRIAEFILPDSELLVTAQNMANGTDATETDPHTLDDSPFSDESATNFTQSDSEHFTVDVKLTKTMHLDSGDDATDTMNYRFYYTLKDETWYLYNMVDISEEN